MINQISDMIWLLNHIICQMKNHLVITCMKKVKKMILFDNHNNYDLYHF